MIYDTSITPFSPNIRAVINNIYIFDMDKKQKAEQITIEGFRTYLDGTQAPFKMDLETFQISVGFPLTINDLNELPMNLDSWTKNSVFTVIKIDL